MSKFQVGYASVNVDPPLGIEVTGYFVKRVAKGFLDHLEVGALVIKQGKKKIAMVSVDHCGIANHIMENWYEVIKQRTHFKRENVFIAATHTHTGPELCHGHEDQNRYIKFLGERICDAINLAEADLKDAKMGYIVGHAPDRIAYIRRYKMKDGSIMTCPPVDSPDIDHPLGTLDQRVNVVRFDRVGGPTIVLVNYGLHADTVNGEMISSDFPGWMRRTLDKALDGVKTIFFNGCEGDVGSTNVHPKDGDMNDTEISFDNEMKSPGMARFIGRALAGTVLQVYDKVKYVDVDSVDIIRKDIVIAANTPDPKDLPLAHKYKELHQAGRDDLIPYEAMELTTVIAEAYRMCKLENGPTGFTLSLTGVRLGDIAFVGIPGEPFTEIGVDIKKTEGWGLILPCALVNGSRGYFPTKAAYDEGGYEVRASNYRSDVAETIVNGSRELLSELKN